MESQPKRHTSNLSGGPGSGTFTDDRLEESEAVDNVKGNNAFLTQQASCTFELTEIVAARTTPMQAEVRQNSSDGE